MEQHQARTLIAHATLNDPPQVWADLGSGDGTFTTALASLLAPGSVIHAIDRDRQALNRIASPAADVHIDTHTGDFTVFPWPFGAVDGVLMANSLHYVRDQQSFLEECVRLISRPHLLLVEYDTDRANPWVPYPLTTPRATALLRAVGMRRVERLGTVPSAFRGANLYGLFAAAD